MITETDPRVTARINLDAVLATLPELVRLAPEAHAIALRDPRPTSIGFAVRGGPRSVLTFRDGMVEHRAGSAAATILLPFTSPAAFTKVIDGAAQPIPVTGLHRITFLLKVFAPLATLLGRYLKPSEADLADPAFREASTILTLHTATAAVAQVANHDVSGQFSAHLVPDGDVVLEVLGSVSYTLRVADHHFTFVPQATASPRAALTFADLDVAGRLLTGEASAMACICDGSMSMRGMLPMVDNVNRILDRVGQYLGE